MISEIKKRVDVLKIAFDSSSDSAKALKEAHDEMKASIGPLTISKSIF